MTVFVPLQKPVVNLNGTSRNELVREHADCANALREAAAIIGGRLPHGRDYQTVRDSDDGELARDAFRQRMVALRSMADEFEQMALAIMEGGK